MILGYVEVALAAVLIAAILLGIVGLVMSMGLFHGDPFNYSDFSVFLSSAFTLVIGIEFVRMLIKHTPGAVVEVLLFAIARQLIVEHAGTWQTLVGVVSIAGVFAVRKFLFSSSFSPADSYIFTADKKLTDVSRITRISLPADGGETVGALLAARLNQQHRPLEVGARAHFGASRCAWPPCMRSGSRPSTCWSHSRRISGRAVPNYPAFCRGRCGVLRLPKGAPHGTMRVWTKRSSTG